MRGLQDTQFSEYYTELLKLDWTGLDLWAVGGIVSDWDTQDIDCVIMGDRPESEINALLLAASQTGPWSLFYTRDPRAITLDRYTRRPTLITVGSKNSNGDKLNWRTFKFPMTKTMKRMKLGQYHGEPVQLIQNGSQVYF